MTARARAAEVWAPHADRVDLVVGDRRVPLVAAEHGYWRSEAAELGPGDDYSFTLDAGPRRPDPRSHWQPQGVHGPSRVVDHSAFSWSDDGWRGRSLHDAVVYELHVGTFTPDGTFDAAIDKLPHLVDLGVTVVEVMPVAQFPGARGWGYDGVDLYAPQQSYGGPAALKQFVDACHGAGIAVVMDVVYNHLGPSGNYLSDFGPYFTDRYATPWGQAVNLDGPLSTEVRRFFLDNAAMWLRDYHCDGLRLDAVHAIVDTSAVHFLEELASRIEDLQEELGRDLFLIAESDLNNPRLVWEPPTGYGVDAQWSDDFHHSIHAALTGERSGYYSDFGRIGDIAKALRDVFVYDGRYSAYRQRNHGRPVGSARGSRFLGYMQNHDQIGNRARGDRSSALVPPGLLKVAAALVFTSPFVPMLFQGEEWGATSPFAYFTDHDDPDLARAVSSGRKAEFAAFGWRDDEIPDPQDPETFERSKLEWEELARSPHDALFEWHKRLIELRRRTPDLRDGRRDEIRAAYDEEERWLLVERGTITVMCNLGERLARLRWEQGRRRTLLLASGTEHRRAGDEIELPPHSVAIFSSGG